MRHLAVVLLALAACARAERSVPSDYLFVWTASEDSTRPDYLAVLDVTEDSDRYGGLVTTLPVPGLHNVPHHTEHEMPEDGLLFANGFATGQTFIFDLTQPAAPRLAARFGDVEGYMHPHSYLRMPGGHVLATFQMRHDSTGMHPGGLVELMPTGQPVRSASAEAPGALEGLRVYSAGIVPALDRIVTTTTDMEADYPASRQLQVWRLSDLVLLQTITLPDGPAGGEGTLTAEPRVLEDGRTVLVSTFSCGLYLMEGLEGDTPSGRLVATFPRKERTYCAIPVVVGHYYLVTVPAWSAVVSLDVSDPGAPREVSRVALDSTDVPHWISVSPDHRRVVLTGYGTLRNRVLILRLDPDTGELSLDTRFREPGAGRPGFQLTGVDWERTGNAPGVPHGAVFSRP